MYPKLVAIRRGVLEKTFERCFRNMKQYSISLKAVPTEIKSKPHNAPKGKKAKQQQHIHKEEEAREFGFILKEAPVRSFLMTSGRESTISASENLAINSALFAVPIGATLISNALAAAGVTQDILKQH